MHNVQSFFGMSQNFLSKAFRGYGKLLLQYKTYPWAETINEFIICFFVNLEVIEILIIDWL